MMSEEHIFPLYLKSWNGEKNGRDERREMSEELKPCPFCGGEPSLKRQARFDNDTRGPDAWAFFFVCRSCSAEGPWSKTEGGALMMWNMRPDAKSECKAFSEPPRFFYYRSSGRLYCDQRIEGITTGTQKTRKDGTTIYLVGNVTWNLADKIAAMLGGTLEVE